MAGRSSPEDAELQLLLSGLSRRAKRQLLEALRASAPHLPAGLPHRGGHPSLGQTAPNAVRLAMRLRRQGRSLREIAAELERASFVNKAGRQYNPQSVRSMITGPQKRN